LLHLLTAAPGTEQTKSDVRYAVANGGKADSARTGQNRRE
jgi:hypothetical protein